jgi:hypothetical protein
MKNLLIILVSALLATSTSVYAVQKKPVPVAQKKIAKKHQRVDGIRIADDKPTAPAKKKK